MRQIQGSGVRRDFAEHRDRWQPAEVGARLELGDGVRTERPSSAVLALADGSELRMRPGTLIRFLVDGATDDEQVLDVQTGEAVLLSGTSDMRLRTHLGLAIVLAGSRVLLARQGEDIAYQIEVGELRFRDADGQMVQLKAGERIRVGIGMAVIRPSERAEPEALAQPPQLPSQIALVAHVQHDGVRARGREQDEWDRLGRGEHELRGRTELQLPADSAVRLERGQDQAQLRGAGEFVVGAEGVLVEARRGDMHVTAGARDVEIAVPGGVIVVRGGPGGSDADVRVDARFGSLAVRSGTAALKRAEVSEELQAGDESRWEHSRGQAVAESNAIGYCNLAVPAGQSFTVHAPEVPVAVGFEVAGKCAAEAVVELAGGKLRARGAGRVDMLVPAGARGYVVRCSDERGAPGGVVARGSVQVLRDAGVRKLPTRPPTAFVEANGRSYTIYYQNQLPEISVHWPNAPDAASYRLEVDGESIELGKPEHMFRSGSLRDGAHRLIFQGQERRSRPTTVQLSFDNAAPKASLSAPADRSFSPGDTVSVEGVALPTWQVSADGGTITVDATDRFSGQVVTSVARPDIALRLSHPKLGTHYYLRRASGSP